MSSKTINSGCPRGVTLIELIVVVAVIAIVAGIAAANLPLILPSFQARSSARTSAVMMERARQLAANFQKPVRAAVDCRERNASSSTDPTKPCVIRLYVAMFDQADDGRLSGWQLIDSYGETQAAENAPKIDSYPRLLGDLVNIEPDPSAALAALPASGQAADHDWLYWAVFFPNGRVQASHSPMLLNYKAKGGSGHWRLGLNSATGQVTARKAD